MEHLVAIAIAGITGLGWGTGKLFTRIRSLEDRIDRFPIEYVLKQDYHSHPKYHYQLFCYIRQK